MNAQFLSSSQQNNWFANGLLVSVLVLLGLTVFMPAQAYHFPWDQGHDTTDPNRPDDPGPCEGGECENDPDNCDSQGSPVYLSTGHFIWQETDVQLKGRPSMTVTRTFNSHDPRFGLMGTGWSMSCDQGLVYTVKYESSDGDTGGESVGQYVRRLPNGKRYIYAEQDDGSFTAPGLFDVVTPVGDGTAKLEQRDGSYNIYTESGQLQTEVDRNGNAINYDYDEQGRLTQKADDNGRALYYEYNTNGLITTIRDHSGREWLYDYDIDGRLVAVIDPTGGVRRYDYTTYTPRGDGQTYTHLTRVTDASGVVETDVTYNGSLVASYSEYENTFTYQYEPANQRTTKTDSEGSQWVFTYNETGQYTLIEAPLGRTAQYDRDEDSLVTRHIDPMGTQYQFTYDEYGNPLTRTDERGTVITTYDEDGNPWPISIQTRSGRTTALTYDSQGNPLNITDPGGDTTSMTWTSNGDLAQTTNALGHVTSFTYNDYGLPLTATDALGRTTQYQYDARGNLVQVINPAGETQTFQYDDRDRMIASTDGNGDTTTYTHDAAGRPVRVTAPNGQTVQYDYDLFGRLSRRTFYDGTVTEYDYRSDNLLARITRPDGVVISHDYDDAKRLVQKTIGSEDTYSYDYNPRDELVRAENDTGVVTLTYDAFGRITSETVNGETMAYQYNAEDEMTQLDGLGISQTQSYDIKGLLSQLDVDGTLYQYTYDALDRLTTLDRNAADSSLTYDDANQLSQINHGGGHRSYDYEYDAVSRVSAWQGVADESRSFEYDNAGRLTSVQSPSQPETFNYDALGNRLNNNAQYDAANRLLEDDNHQYSYDVNGNRITKTDKATGEVERYTYNSLDQLVSYRSYPNADTDVEPAVDYSYTYGPLERRWSKQNNLGTEATAFYWSGTSLIGEANNGTERRYILEGLTPVGFVENNELYHFLRDHIGTAHEVVNNSGAMVWQADYWSFGDLSSAANTVENNLRFAGQYEDQESELFYNFYRQYDPVLGRYLQSDTLGLIDGPNTYVYAYANPVHYVDPYGTWGIVGAAYGAVAGGVGGYISGGWQGAVAGVGAGAAVGAINPFGANIAGAAAGAGVASLLGQGAGNFVSGKDVSSICNYDLSAAAGAALGGAIGGPLGQAVGRYFPVIRYPVIGRPLGSPGFNQIPGNTAGSIVEGVSVGVGELGGQQF